MVSESSVRTKKTMRILLIQPPIEDFYITRHRTYPLGLTYIGGFLKEKGYTDIEIIDYCRGTAKKIDLPEKLKYLKRNYTKDKSSFKLFNQYYRFSKMNDQIVDEIIGKKPDIIAFTSLFTTYYPVIRNIVRSLKSRAEILTAIGGFHPSSDPDSIMEEKLFDFIFLKTWQ